MSFSPLEQFDPSWPAGEAAATSRPWKTRDKSSPCSKQKPCCTCRNQYFTLITPGGSPANPSHCLTFLGPSLPQPSPALTCNDEFQLSPCIADGSLLQFPSGKVSPKPPWDVFRGQAARMATNRASHQNWLGVKRKITTPELFFPRDYCSALIIKTCLIAHRRVGPTQNIMLMLSMEKNITIVKVENGSSYKCMFEMKYRCRLTLP